MNNASIKVMPLEEYLLILIMIPLPNIFFEFFY